MGNNRRNAELPPLAEIGRRIQAARNQRGMTVAQLSDMTRVSSRWIDYIEAGEFDMLPGRSYVIGFTGLICSALDRDRDDVIQTIKAEMYPPLASPEPASSEGSPASWPRTFLNFLRAIFRK